MGDYMKKLLTILTIVTTSLILISCTNNNSPEIITTLYPQYDIATNIAGDKLNVELATPFGSEIHEYSPSPKDIVNINNSKLFLYTSLLLEPWVANLLSDDLNSLNLSKSLNIHSEHEDNHDHEHDHSHADLHFWTDPHNFLSLINVIRDSIIEIDINNKAYYEENAKLYYEKILTIDEEFTNYLISKPNPTIYFAGHNAMEAFSDHYNINIIGLSDSFKPDADLTSGQLTFLIEEIKTNNITHLFIEELAEPKAALVIKRELDKENLSIVLLELHGYHNITLNQSKEGISYADLFRQNTENIKKALGN